MPRKNVVRHHVKFSHRHWNNWLVEMDAKNDPMAKARRAVLEEWRMLIDSKWFRKV